MLAPAASSFIRSLQPAPQIPSQKSNSHNKHQLIPGKPFKGLGPLGVHSHYSNDYCFQPGNVAVRAFTYFLLEMTHFISTESFTEGLQ